MALSLPEFLSESFTEPTQSGIADAGPVEYLHNWLYSVVPVSVVKQLWDNTPREVGSYYKDEFALVAYLTGYCRACGKAFSQQIPSNEGILIEVTQLDVPKFGCVGPA